MNASMDELDRRAKAVAPFWVGPGVDDAPPQAAAAPALKKKAESPAKESAPLAPAPKAAASTPAKPKPPPAKAETPAKPKPPPPAPKKAPAEAPKKMAMPELPKVKLPAVDVKLPSIPVPTIPVPELDGVAEDAIRAIRVAMSRAPKYDDDDGGDDGDGDTAGAGFNFAPSVDDGIDKDDPEYREMVKTRRRRPPRAASLPAPPTPEEKEARRAERARLRREREERRANWEDAEREATAAKRIADALAAPPKPDPAWMTAKGTDILAVVEAVVAKHPKGEAVKKPPSATKAPPAKDAAEG